MNQQAQDQLASAMQGLGIASENAAAIIKTELGATVITIMTAVKDGVTNETVSAINELPAELRPVLAGAVREIRANAERLLIYLESAN